MATPQQMLEGGDIAVVVLYYLAIVGVGIWAGCRMRRGSVTGYFLADRAMLWPMIGASVFVSNIGTEHFIGLAGSGAVGGVGVGAWELNAMLILQLLGFLFLPVYIACGCYTCPEYLAKRFGGTRIRMYFAVLSLLMYVLTKLSINLYTGSLFIQQSTGWDLYGSIFLLIAITGILTITGGLTAVIYTDTLQATLMVIGALILMGMSFFKIGGFNGLIRGYVHAVPNVTVANTSCHLPSRNAFRMFKGIHDDEIPWLGFLLGQTPGSIWYWCTDQVIVQRTLAAKNLSHAQGAVIFAAFIKILPLFFMVMPGMVSRMLYPNEVACVDPEECYRVCQSYAGCSNIAYPRLVLGIMPEGLRGLMMAVVIAALMSDLDSIFNSASTLFTIDIYKHIRKKASIRELMIIGRVWVVVMIAVSVAWVPVAKEQQGGQIFIYINEVINYFGPGVSAVFIVALLWKRCNEKGAFWGLAVAFIVGLTRLVLVFIYPPPRSCGDEDNRPHLLVKFHFMYFAAALFGLTIVVTIVVSLLTASDPPEMLVGTTYWTRFGVHKEAENITMQDTPEVNTADNTATNCTADAEDELMLSNITPKVAEPHSVFRRAFDWICGFAISEEAEKAAEKEMNERVNVRSLHQGKITKILLSAASILISLIGLFLMVFWSTWSPAYADEFLRVHNITWESR